MHKLNVSVLVAIFYLLITDSSFGQRLRDLKLIFSEQEVSVYECAASAGRYASFRTTNFDADMHYIYDFKTGKTRAIYESGEGFMEEVEESTSNLVWSPTKETYFIFKMVKDGVGTPVFGEINQNIDISLTRMNVKGENQTQANTSTILAWGGRDEVLFSRCKRCQNNTIDVPASDYDLFSFPMRNYLRGKTVTDQYKPLPKSPEIREMNASYINRFESIVSGIDASGSSNLYKVNPRDEKYKVITNTPKLSESWPAVGPDGEYVIFCDPHIDKETVADLYILDLSALNVQPSFLVGDVFIASTAFSSVGQYTWSKDGKYVVFVRSDPDNQNPLALVDIQTKQIKEIDTGLEFVSSFSISGDGENIIMVAAGKSGAKEKISYKVYAGKIEY